MPWAAAAAQLGSQAISLAVALNNQLGVPLNKISPLFHQTWGLTVTPGGVVEARQRTARRAEPTDDALIDTVRHSLVVAPDETGWKVAAALQWLWASATPDTTVYAIQAGRGFAEAAAMLGPDYAGVVVRDGWAPDRQFTQAVPQTCLAVSRICSAGVTCCTRTIRTPPSPPSCRRFCSRRWTCETAATRRPCRPMAWRLRGATGSLGSIA
jgi:hypothetical protein